MKKPNPKCPVCEKPMQRTKRGGLACSLSVPKQQQQQDKNKMCEFKSGIVLRDESLKGGFKLLMSPWTESHSDLIAIHNLRDGSRLRFARVEFKPTTMDDADKPDTYRLQIDEERCPEWFDEEMKELVSDRMRNYIKSIIIKNDVCLLIGGQFILSGKATIGTAKNCIITAMLDSSNVGVMRGSSNVGEMRGSSNVGEMRDSSKVGEMLDSSKVGEMLGSSKVGVMLGSSNVGVMWDSSNVGVMRGSSNVGEMLGSSKVGVMRGSSNVGEMLGSSKVVEMLGSSKVGVMRDSSKVDMMRDSSNVGVMWDSSKVGVMRDSSNVGVMWDSSKVDMMRDSSKAPRNPNQKNPE